MKLRDFLSETARSFANPAANLGSLPEGTAMLAARIPTKLRNRFKAKVAERGMKMDQVVRALIAEYVNRD